MIKKIFALFLVSLLAVPFPLLDRAAEAATGCNFPISYHSWSDKSTGDFLTVADVNQRTNCIELLQPFKGSADAVGYAFSAKKSRGSIASPTVITTGDNLLTISGYGYVGPTNIYVEAARILLDSEGTISDAANGIGGRFAVSIRTAGGSLSERFTIDSAGVATFNVSVIDPTLIGGTTANSILKLRSTSGVGTADFIIFQTGNNGAIEVGRMDGNANYRSGGTADRSTAAGTNQLILYSGTSPSGTLSNGASFFVASGEMRVMDALGNNTLLSPHSADFLKTLPIEDRPYPWVYDSKNEYIGKRIKVDLAGAIVAVEKLTGKKFVFVEDLPEGKRSWTGDQDLAVEKANARIAAQEERRKIALEKGAEFDERPEQPHIKQAPPEWMAVRGVK